VDTVTDRNPNVHPISHEYPDADDDDDSDRNADVDKDSDGDADPNPDSDTDADGDTDRDAADPDTDPNRYGDADSNPHAGLYQLNRILNHGEGWKKSRSSWRSGLGCGRIDQRLVYFSTDKRDINNRNINFPSKEYRL